MYIQLKKNGRKINILQAGIVVRNSLNVHIKRSIYLHNI